MIKVEIWPRGDERGARQLGMVGLANVSKLAEVSDYLVVRVDDAGCTEAGKVPSHRRSDGFWPLLAQVGSQDGWAELTDEEAATVKAMLEVLQRDI